MGIIKLKKVNEEATVTENFEKSLVTEEVIPAENIVAVRRVGKTRLY